MRTYAKLEKLIILFHRHPDPFASPGFLFTTRDQVAPSAETTGPQLIVDGFENGVSLNHIKSPNIDDAY